MKITYTGVQELNPVQKKKVEDKFGKLSKFFDRKGEREAHLIITTERHMHHAEITVNSHDHPLVGIGSNADLFTAVTLAVEKMEKQVLKMREKWRDTKRGPKEEWPEPAPAEAAKPASKAKATAAALAAHANGRVFRVGDIAPKPMTLDEALMEMEKDGQYLAYRDADTDRVSVLVRRRDGNFDLIEG